MSRFRSDQFPPGSSIRKQLEAAERESVELEERAGARAAMGGRRSFPEEALQREIIREADSTPLVLLLEREWWPSAVTGETLGRFLYHVPNGGGRTAAEAAILIGLGVRAGVFDLCLWLPVRRVLVEEFPSGTRGRTERIREEFRGGLYLELKAGTNGLTDKQREFGERARLVAYDTAEVRSIHEFRSAVADYLKGARPLWKSK